MIDVINFLLLASSVILSTGRNILSKNISGVNFGTKRFFTLQTAIFFTGGILLLVITAVSGFKLSALTLIYAIIYGALLVSAQWNYTVSLKSGRTGTCSTVYSLGFILPTVFGSIAFTEYFGVLDILGVIAVIPAIILTGLKKSDDKSDGNGFFIPLIIAMVCSGGLGIMQKIQQYSPYADEKSCFMLVAFAVATVISGLGILIGKKDDNPVLDKKVFSGAGVGLAFASCNLLNTILAGRLPSAVFFPILNIGTILFSLILGILLFKEKLTKKDLIIFLLGVTAIILITV